MSGIPVQNDAEAHFLAEQGRTAQKRREASSNNNPKPQCENCEKDLIGAGDRDRTGVSDLEGQRSTIELRPREPQ